MADEPEERRGYLIVEKVLSVKTTVLKLAPSLHIGSIFGGPVARVVLAAAVPVAMTSVIVAESAGAIDVIDSDPQVVELTIIQDEGELELIVRPPSVAGGTVFDQLFEAIAGIEVAPVVTVNVEPINPETQQTLTQIGTLLESIAAQNRAILAALQAIEFEPPPVNPPGLTQSQADEIIEQLDEVLDSQDVIEGAIFPGRGSCPECPDSVTTDE